MPNPLLSIVFSLLAQPGELPFEARLKAMESASPFISAAPIGQSRQGRVIRGIWVTDFADKAIAPSDRPTLILIAGLDARHTVGVETALNVADRLIADHKDLLKSVRFGIVPCANPDTFARHLDPAKPRVDFGRTIVPGDADGDRRTDEDPAEDLNGDGIISMMRVKNPHPRTGLRAEFCLDPDNPRLLKRPDPAKGQRAEYALLIEGIDNDGDGKFNEDGVGGAAGGGVDLNMNFPYRWPEFSDGAGPYPLSEPESLVLAQWLLDQPNIAAIVVFGPGDTILNQPPAGRFDQNGSLTLGIENGDKAAYDEIARLFKEATRMSGAPGMDLAGSLPGWAYSNLGTLSVSTPVWVRPDLVSRDAPRPDRREGEVRGEAGPADRPEAAPAGGLPESDIRARIAAFMAASPAERERMMQEFNSLPPEEQERIRSIAGLAPGQSPMRAAEQIPASQPAAQPAAGPPPGRGRGRGQAGGGGGRPAGGPPPASETRAEDAGEEAKWLAYNQEQVKAGAASGFVEWSPFQHPQLGEVEIGGFIPGFKINPPASELPRLADEQVKFITSLAAKFPRIEAKPPTVERLGPGLYRVTVRAVNEGAMASMPEVNTKARQGLPTMLTLDVPVTRIVSGEKIVRAWVLPASGGQVQAEWILTGQDGSTVDILVNPSIGARSTVRVELKETAP
jgi:hypothetical protein